jgi:hypothetical protein
MNKSREKMQTRCEKIGTSRRDTVHINDRIGWAMLEDT